jgi:predicted MFS family arabinose efflux permease
LPWGVVLVFLNDFLQGKGMSKGVATLVVMTFGSGGLLGSLIAGIIGQWLYNWRKGALPVFTGICTWLGTPALLVLVNDDSLTSWPLLWLLVFVFLGGSVASITGVVIRPLVMNVNVPESRGIALALQVRKRAPHSCVLLALCCER